MTPRARCRLRAHWPRRGAKVTLIHVMEPAPLFTLDYLPENWREDMHRAITADLGGLAAGFEDGHAVVVEGDPAHEVLDYAQRKRG